MIIKIFFLLLSVCMNIDNWVNSATLESYLKKLNVSQNKEIPESELCNASKFQKAAVCKNLFSLLRKNSDYRNLYVDYSAFKNDSDDLSCFHSFVYLDEPVPQFFLSCPAQSAIQSDDINYKFGNNKIAVYPTRMPTDESMDIEKTDLVESLMFVFLKIEKGSNNIISKFHNYPTFISKHGDTNFYELIYGYENFLWGNIAELKPEELNVIIPKQKQNVTLQSINYTIDQIQKINKSNNILSTLNVEELMNLCTLILGRWNFEDEFLLDEESFRNNGGKEENVTFQIPDYYGTILTHLKGYGCFSKTNSSENPPVYKLVPGVEKHEVLLVKKSSENYFVPVELIEDVNIDYIRYTMSGSELENVIPMERESS